MTLRKIAAAAVIAAAGFTAGQLGPIGPAAHAGTPQLPAWVRWSFTDICGLGRHPGVVITAYHTGGNIGDMKNVYLCPRTRLGKVRGLTIWKG